MTVRTTAGSSEKPMINIFQNLGAISFSWTVRHCSVMMGYSFQKYIFTSLDINLRFPNVGGKRRKREVCMAAGSGRKG